MNNIEMGKTRGVQDRWPLEQWDCVRQGEQRGVCTLARVDGAKDPHPL